ncbi:MAG: excinuclease ABC subunit UvrC [Treponema sp.]|nr:excinuclease ABC subunit UvrC [Treponema sp.]
MSDKTIREQLHETALKAPHSAGVYLWRNAEGTVIYVGKAKVLKNRLSSYFSGQKNIKTQLLIANAVSIEYIVTANEYEALLLENNLIKKYSPRYNICLKDGKSYPVIRITNEEFPKIYRTRTVHHDGSQYYGPFPDVYALDTFLETIFKLYPLRRCRTFKSRSSPCLYYHMGQCKAPCCKKITKESYTEYFGEIISLLEGKDDAAIERLKTEMRAAADELNFEKAARLRDGINALNVLHNQNIVESFDENDSDYIAYWREGELVSFTVLKIRNGKLLGRNNFREISLNEDDELVAEFMNAYYNSPDQIPPYIYVSTSAMLPKTTTEPSQTDELPKASLASNEASQSQNAASATSDAAETPEDTRGDVNRWLHDTYGVDSQIILVTDDIPSAPRHKAAIQMATQNAHEDIIRRLRERGDTPAMEELKDRLHLDRLPIRIEGFDIAHIGGKWPVASLISFYNGNPDKKNYRYFRLKTTDGLIDDFASMREAVTRRYTRLLNEGADMPDLLLIDGGIGQVNAVDAVIKALGLDIPIAGLAKRDEEIWRPHTSEPICLPKRSDALRLLQRVRDETHRFATSRNQRLRTKENVVSIFMELPGVGEKRALTLQKKYTTLENLCKQKPADIAETIKIKEEDAADMLAFAYELLEIRNEKKAEQKLSLIKAGTTKELAAEAGRLAGLADEALGL